MIHLGCVLPLLVLGSSLTADGWAQRKSTTKHTSSPVLSMRGQGEGTISVSFVDLPAGSVTSSSTGGVLNLGKVSYGALPRSSNVQVQTSGKRLLVTTRFGMNVQDSSLHVATATMLASLVSPDAAHILRLDGITLTVVPQVIQGRVQLGKISQHRLEIEVPTSLTEKDAELHNSIVFQVIAN